MEEHKSTEEWKSTLNAILAVSPDAVQYYRLEIEPSRAIIRQFHAVGREDQARFGIALVENLDETAPVQRNSALLYHLLKAFGGVKPARGLSLLEKLLRDGTYRDLEYQNIRLHTLLLSTAGEYSLSTSLREWIREDCTRVTSFDHRRIGFSVLAGQELSPAAFAVFESAIVLATDDAKERQLAVELRGLSYPYADLYKWLQGLRMALAGANSSAAQVFTRIRHLMAAHYLPAGASIVKAQSPWETLLIAEVLSDHPFTSEELALIGLTYKSAGVDLVRNTLQELYSKRRWDVRPVTAPTVHDRPEEAESFQDVSSGYSLLTRGPGDSVVLHHEQDKQLLELLRHPKIKRAVDNTESDWLSIRGREWKIAWSPKEVN